MALLAAVILAMAGPTGLQLAANGLAIFVVTPHLLQNGVDAGRVRDSAPHCCLVAFQDVELVETVTQGTTSEMVTGIRSTSAHRGESFKAPASESNGVSLFNRPSRQPRVVRFLSPAARLGWSSNPIPIIISRTDDDRL